MAILVAASFDAEEWSQWWPLLEAALPGETLIRDREAVPASQIDIAIVANPVPGSLAGLPSLRLIQSLWAGIDGLLGDASVPAGVPMARMVDPAMNEAMAQTALWAVTGLQRDFFAYAAQQRQCVWRPHPFRRPDDVVVAVLGLGQMGQATVRRLTQAGYRVAGWRRSGGQALASVLAQADVAVNLLPLTEQTRGIFDAHAFACMRPGAGFVNLGRGGHVVEPDLLAALDGGHLSHAVLDVFATEPLPAGHPFWRHPAVTVLPHVAGPTDSHSAVAVVARNVAALRAGTMLAHLVDRTLGY